MVSRQPSAASTALHYRAGWLAPVICAAAVLIASCGGDNEGSPSSQSSPAPTFSRATEPPTLPSPPRGNAEAAELDADPSLPGAYFAPHPGTDGRFPSDDDRDHLAEDAFVPICTRAQIDVGNLSIPLCYTSNPPTSGPHAGSPAPFRVLANPVPKENLIHSMEHGGVVVWYNTEDVAVIGELAAIVNQALDRGHLVVMSAYAGMEPDTIALTAWTRLDKFPVGDLDRQRLSDFIEAHQRRFNPEGF